MILLTNDDGVRAPGLAILGAALLAAGHELVIAAPADEKSGSGTGLGTVVDAAAIAVTPTHVAGCPGARCLAVDAPPALIVRAACEGVFGPVPELVVSGVNAGHNTGRLILHSGTVGAALTALLYDLPGLALSAGKAPGGRPDTAATVGVAAARVLLEQPQPIVLNINVPDRPGQEVVGIDVGSLGRHSVAGLALHSADGGLLIERTHRTTGLEPGTDAALVVDGRISVTPLGRLGEQSPGETADLLEELRTAWAESPRA